MVPKKTEVLNDDDELEVVTDEAPQYPRWNEPGQLFDLVVTTTGQGTDFNGDPCFRVEGELHAVALNFGKDNKRVTLDPGTEVRINAGQPILDRKLRKADRQYGGLVGRRVVITYRGLIKTSNGRTAKDFDVQVGKPLTFADLGVE